MEGFWLASCSALDGNDLRAVKNALRCRRHLAIPLPRVILFDTLMGNGVPFLEAREKNHFIRVESRRMAEGAGGA